MTSAGLRIDPEQLIAVARRFHEASADLQKALTRARSELSELGAPWGEDEEGAAFAKQYLPAAKHAWDGLGLFCHAVSGIGETLTQAATQLRHYEESTQAHLTNPTSDPRTAAPPVRG